jgi:hypothetical protein
MSKTTQEAADDLAAAFRGLRDAIHSSLRIPQIVDWLNGLLSRNNTNED